MQIKGELRKMPVHLNHDNLVEYQLLFYHTNQKTELSVLANDFIGSQITFKFTGNIYCISCGIKTVSSFNQGFCYNCFKNSPESAECIIRPELCRAHEGIGRDVAWEQINHNQPHIVYLAATDAIKVGITRKTNIPARWIDQGASEAIILAETPNRYEAGIIEVALKSTFVDKTNWRTMLTNQIDTSIDLESKKWELEEILPNDISQYISDEDQLTPINYPVIQFPEKVSSVNLEKQPEITGKLMGIKGQYFLFENGKVMNIRRHTGYEVEFIVE